MSRKLLGTIAGVAAALIVIVLSIGAPACLPEVGR